MVNILLRDVSDKLANKIDEYAIAQRLPGGRPTAVMHIVEESLAAPKSTNAAQVAGRLNRVIDDLDKLGKMPFNPKLPLPRIAEILGFSKVGPLEALLAAKEEPTFEFLGHFSAALGVNASWLKYGEGSPYSLQERISEPLEILDYIFDHDLGAQATLYAVTVDNEDGNTLFAITADHITYTQLTSTDYHLSARVGATGQSHQGDIARLTAFFWHARLTLSKPLPELAGLRIDQDAYHALISRETHPGLILTDRRYHSYWPDDFHDLYSRSRSYSPAFQIAKDNARESLLGYDGKNAPPFTNGASLKEYWISMSQAILDKRASRQMKTSSG